MNSSGCERHLLIAVLLLCWRLHDGRHLLIALLLCWRWHSGRHLLFALLPCCRWHGGRHLLIALLLCCRSHGVLGVHEVRAGVVLVTDGVLPFRAEMVLPAIDMAIEQAEQEFGVRFVTFHKLHPDPCDPVFASGAIAELYYEVSTYATAVTS